MDLLAALATQTHPVGFREASGALLLAFGLGQVIALVYVATFRGLSYSRTFVQGIALGAVVTCMLLLAIGDSIAAGIGLAGGLSIVRFRTTMRDPRDMVFVFAGLGVGIVSGLRAFPAAISGTLVFVAAALLLDRVGLGTRSRADALVRFLAQPGSVEPVGTVIAAHTRGASLVTLRQAAQGDEVEHVYQVELRTPSEREALLAALQRVPGVRLVRVGVLDPSEDL